MVAEKWACAVSLTIASFGCSAVGPADDVGVGPTETVGQQRQALTSLDALALTKSANIRDPQTLALKNDVFTVGTPGAELLTVKGLWGLPYVSHDFTLTGSIGGQTAASDFTWDPIEISRTATISGVSVKSRVVLLSGQATAVVIVDLNNTSGSPVTLSPSFSAAPATLDKITADSKYGFGYLQSSTATSTTVDDGNHRLLLQNQVNSPDRTVAICSPSLTWNGMSTNATSVSVPAQSHAFVYLTIAIGAPSDAKTRCHNAAFGDPTALAASARSAYAAQLDDLYTRIPKLSTNNPQLLHFYERSAEHALLNRWSVPGLFFLQPYYSTGGINGGTLGSYLWNFGEPWEVLQLVDPTAVKAHIKAFSASTNLLPLHYAFHPVAGSAFGTWYPVNQEKYIGLVHNYIRLTGDTAFMNESDGVKTTLQRVLENATLNEGAQPSAMIDYGDVRSHLELSDPNSYNHVLPDLNGRRYESYKRAAELFALAGDAATASALTAKANALGPSLKQALWNPTARWFDYVNAGTRGTRYTVQMFYLLGSGVLDTDEELGLLNHLNEREFLSPFGMHSLAKQDAVYDDGDIDNGGPGICTSFPLQIAERLYREGLYQKAESILSRVLWWGERMPTWGDSFVADRMDYRRDTPLQNTLDALAGVQVVVFGMFGIDAGLDGTITVSPHPPAFASQMSLQGVKIRGVTFDVSVNGSSFTVSKSGSTLSAPIGSSIKVSPGGLSTLQRASDYVAASVVGDRLTVLTTSASFASPSVDRVYAYDGTYVYWHDDIHLRRGQISGGAVQVDTTWKYDAVSAVDRFFAVSGGFVYWQSGNQLRRGTVGNGTLVIDTTFSTNDFTSADRLFSASGTTVYWQSGAQLRRGTVAAGHVTVDSTFSTNDFTSADTLFAASGTTVYWQSANQLRRGSISGGHVAVDSSFIINDFDPVAVPFSVFSNRVYWHVANKVQSGWLSTDKVALNDLFKGFSSADTLFAVSGGKVYWQSGPQLRRGALSGGVLTIDTTFKTDDFTSADRLFAVSGNNVYWQSGSQLRAGTVVDGHISIDNSLSSNDFTSADRLFAASGSTVYWQSGSQLRRGTVSAGHVTVDSSFSSNDFSSADRLFAASGTQVYWQSGSQLRRATISGGHPVIDATFTSNAFSPGERLFTASGDTVYWQTL